MTFIQGTDEKDLAVLDAVRPALEEAVGRQRTLKAKVDALREERPDSRVPTVEEIVGLSQDVRARLMDDPIAGRELLRYMVLDGTVTLTPNGEGSLDRGAVVVYASGGNGGRPGGGGGGSDNDPGGAAGTGSLGTSTAGSFGSGGNGAGGAGGAGNNGGSSNGGVGRWRRRLRSWRRWRLGWLQQHRPRRQRRLERRKRCPQWQRRRRRYWRQ